MNREEYMQIKKNLETALENLEKVNVIGCGKYFNDVDRYCGHKYNWKNPDKFNMEVWLCNKCSLNLNKTSGDKDD